MFLARFCLVFMFSIELNLLGGVLFTRSVLGLVVFCYVYSSRSSWIMFRFDSVRFDSVRFRLVLFVFIDT